ncbi:MAG: RDD family protein [Smithella sp.]
MTFYKYAGFWRRLIAFTIDGTIIFFIFMILFFIASMAFFSGAISVNGDRILADLNHPTQFSPVIFYLWAFYFVVNIIYFTYFHGATGRTPGKMILGLQVVTEEGNPISFGTAFLRSVGYFVSNILYLGFIWAAFDRRKQSWHDKIAGTVVIIREKADRSDGISILDTTDSSGEAQPVKPPEDNNN